MKIKKTESWEVRLKPRIAPKKLKYNNEQVWLIQGKLLLEEWMASAQAGISGSFRSASLASTASKTSWLSARRILGDGAMAQRFDRGSGVHNYHQKTI